MEELSYSHPVQVRYWDPIYKQYLGGIAYHEFLISGRSGQAFLITEIIAAAEKVGKDQDNATIELDWLAIDSDILGTH